MPVMDRNPGLGDGGSEDLPRTLRREREAQQRAQQHKALYSPAPNAPQSAPMNAAMMQDHDWSHDDGPQPAIVTAIKVPFFRLMLFFLKAVIAAIPAIILFGVILWGLGHLLMTYFPWLVKIQILIHVPK